MTMEEDDADDDDDENAQGTARGERFMRTFINHDYHGFLDAFWGSTKVFLSGCVCVCVLESIAARWSLTSVMVCFCFCVHRILAMREIEVV